MFVWLIYLIMRLLYVFTWNVLIIRQYLLRAITKWLWMINFLKVNDHHFLPMLIMLLRNFRRRLNERNSSLIWRKREKANQDSLCINQERVKKDPVMYLRENYKESINLNDTTDFDSILTCKDYHLSKSIITRLSVYWSM